MQKDDNSTARMRVLLVDDDQAVGDAFRRLLSEKRIDVECTHSGLEALEILDARTFDAIILDLVMPGPVNGFGIISYLEAEHPAMIDSLFIISGMPEQTIMHAAPALLPRFYRKPFEIEEVVDAIRRHVTKSVEPVRHRILLADDDENVRALYASVARGLGYETSHAADGHEAIRQLARETFDAIVLDFVVPHVDGFGVLRYLREQMPAMLPRTLVVTSMTSRFWSAALLEHVYAVREKPVEKALLEQLLTGLLGQARRSAVNDVGDRT